MNRSFADMGREAFAFLEDEGFKFSNTAPHTLFYESANACVIVEWDNRSGELNVWLSRHPNRRAAHDWISLSDLMRMEGIDAMISRMPFQVAQQENLSKFLREAAEHLKSHGKSAVSGDRFYYHRLEAFRDIQAKKLTDDLEGRRVRSEASMAWKERDYLRVVHLYTAIKESLSAAERARLDYARKHLPF